jgi:hypothetical protein
LALILLEMVDLSSRKFFYLNLVWVFELILRLFKVINEFIKVFMMFLGVLNKNKLKIKILGMK